VFVFFAHRVGRLGSIVVSLLPTVLLGLLLTGCDSRKVAELEEGVSTEADVRARFGEPERIRDEPNGDHMLEYPRQPAGTTNYMISIGPDGKMTSLRQVLNPDNFRKVTPGLDREMVRRMLGKPAKMQTFRNKGEEVWDWRFSDGHQIQVFSASFDTDGRVTGTGVTLDPAEAGQRGR